MLNGWGPGKFDAHLLLDGNEKGAPATLIPPAFGPRWRQPSHLDRVGIRHSLECVCGCPGNGREGTFYDPRLQDDEKFPIAAENGFYNVRNDPDLVTSKLPALQFYQLALQAPTPPKGSFDTAAAKKGRGVI